MKTQISRHNAQRLAADRVQQEAEPRCNCTQFPCPIPGGNQCRSKNAVYQATIKVEPRPEVEEEVEEVHTYVGASHDFKERYYRHRTSFNNPAYRTDTTLSKCVWKLKEDNRQFSMEWRIAVAGPSNTLESAEAVNLLMLGCCLQGSRRTSKRRWKLAE